VGASLAAGTTDVDFDNRASYESDDVAGSLFVRYDAPGYYLEAAAFLGRSDSSSVRFPGLGLKAEGDYEIKFKGASVKAGKLWNLGSLRVTPRLGLNFVSLTFPDFEEKGAGDLSLRFSGDSSKSLEIEFGALFAKDLDLAGKTFSPRLNIGVAYETCDTSLALSTAFAANSSIPAFVSESPDAGRLRVLFELGGTLALSDRLDLFADYKGSFRKNDRVHSLTLGLGLSW
jgi:outer membrane autotransporter protein